jgi:hypothetical protein
LNTQVTTPASNIPLTAQVTTPAPNIPLADARLKKKEVNKQDKGPKRRKSWTEMQYKAKKIGPTRTTAPLSKVYQSHIISLKCNLLSHCYLNCHM